MNRLETFEKNLAAYLMALDRQRRSYDKYNFNEPGSLALKFARADIIALVRDNDNAQDTDLTVAEYEEELKQAAIAALADADAFVAGLME